MVTGLDVVLGDVAAYSMSTSRRRARRQLRLQASRASRRAQERAEHREQLGATDGMLTAARTSPRSEEVDDLLGDRDRDVDLRLAVEAPRCGVATTPVEREQRMVLRRRLLREDVERRAGDLARA